MRTAGAAGLTAQGADVSRLAAGVQTPVMTVGCRFFLCTVTSGTLLYTFAPLLRQIMGGEALYGRRRCQMEGSI